ncbi:IS3 family transposase [Bacillus cereus]
MFFIFLIKFLLHLNLPYENIYFYNHRRFQKKLNNLSPYKYRTQGA